MDIHQNQVVVLLSEFFKGYLAILCLNQATLPFSQYSCRIHPVNVIVFNQVRCKPGLTKVYFDRIWGDQSLEVSTEKPFYGPHKFNRRKLLE